LTVPETVFKTIPGLMEYMKYLIFASQVDAGLEKLYGTSPNTAHVAGAACAAVILDACVNVIH